MKTNTCVTVVMRIPPPLMFVATFFAGLGLQRIFPITVHSSGVGASVHVAGVAFLICGVLMALTSVGMFFAARTTLNPFGTASKLITRGPYRVTRNPMYLSLTIAYLGAAGILLQPWPPLLLPLPVTVIAKIVIPFEEARLRNVLGEEFQRYCEDVRRWL